MLTSCGGKDYAYSDYRLEMNFHAGFKIVQLTDLHIAIETDLVALEALLDLDIKESEPDLVVVTGDTFMTADKEIVQETLGYFDSWGVPFAFTYGNHDSQGDYDYRFIPHELSKCQNALYVDYDDDNLTGLANYYVDLNEGGSVKYRLFIIDSNSYHLSGVGYKYDIIHPEQLTQVEKTVEGEGLVTALAFFHIPLYEFDDAYKAYKAGTCVGSGENYESVSYPYVRTDAFDRLKAAGVKGIFVGHDHINDTQLLYQDVVLSYGLKSSLEIYNRTDMVGYKLITLTEDSSAFGLDNITRHYREAN
jgi:3',5'-cyclic AMP phosphodiesterase CpdA